ncbi:hypothetical protein CQW29_08840 [Pantoea coffeiphila]|uniref:DUF2684 domain-containing protein n=1 Tax=Pantoea coffeiphila TaxID=1465635 RepID=A0A2S9ICZ9_9GAMM|nr:hypothetical protein CQW29_08840 [Pantoea coffeiphila]
MIILFRDIAPVVTEVNQRRLEVNQYRWINIWMAILGYTLSGLPAFFTGESFIICKKWKIILTDIASGTFRFCNFSDVAV